MAKEKMSLLLLNFLFVCGIIFNISCNKNSYGNPQKPDKMVVLTEITAGDSANIPIGRTWPAGSGNTIQFQKIETVQAGISSSNGSSETLVLNNAGDYLTNPMAVYSGTRPFQLNTTYTLSASEQSLGSITATTTIPADFQVQKTGTEKDDLNGKPVLRFNIVIQDAGDEKNYYLFESVKQLATVSHFFSWQGQSYNYDTQTGYDLYQQVKNNPGVSLSLDTILTQQFLRMNVYTKDSHTGNASMGSLDSSYHRIFIKDSLFNGQSYETEFMISMDHFKALAGEQAGVVQVQVKSVSKELYDYLLQYEKYNQDFGNFSVSNLNSPVGNIQNGYGVFGGSVKKQWSYYYDPLQ